MVPRLWPQSTIVCLGSGPSLTAADLLFIQNACQYGTNVRSLAINTTYQAAPWVDVLYAPDVRWWKWHPDALIHGYLKFGLGHGHNLRVVGLEWTGHEGIEESPWAVRTGGHSGYAAINVAVHLGAKRIVLLGYDLSASEDGRHHHHDDHPNGSHPNYAVRRGVYETCLGPLAALNIDIVNASRETTITAIPRVPLEEALAS